MYLQCISDVICLILDIFSNLRFFFMGVPFRFVVIFESLRKSVFIRMSSHFFRRRQYNLWVAICLKISISYETIPDITCIRSKNIIYYHRVK